MKVTIAQKKHALGKKQENLRTIERTADDEDTDLLIFPEMFLTGYTLRDRSWYEAENIPGPSSNRISKIAEENQMNIICGMPEKVKGEARLRNVALLATSDGELHKYRKVYLPNFGPFEDKRYFKAGNEVPVFDTPEGKIGMLICYDIFFPELAKAMVQKGAEMIAVISASPSVTRKYFERVLPARAIETTSYLFYSNLVAREESMYFWGGATAVSPKGEIIGKGDYFKEDKVEAQLELENMSNFRSNRPVLDDTREAPLSELKRSREFDLYSDHQ